jgi:hypothetical protein
VLNHGNRLTGVKIFKKLTMLSTNSHYFVCWVNSVQDHSRHVRERGNGGRGMAAPEISENSKETKVLICRIEMSIAFESFEL